MLICPYCGERLLLLREERVYRCERGHTFDIAREGYVNLLRHPSKLQADTREMLVARRRFLDHGYYAPLAEMIGATVGAWLRTHESLTSEGSPTGVLDAGCGEGYYTRALARALAIGTTPSEVSETALLRKVMSGVAPAAAPLSEMQAAGDALHRRPIFGIDLARDGIRMAAQRARLAPDAATAGERQIVWAVADIKDRLPFADASMSAVISVFAPRNVEEYSRLLVPQGLLLAVIPSAAHLQSARERLPLLDMQGEKRERLLTSLDAAFVPVDEQSLAYDITLDLDAQADLLLMTPHPRPRRAMSTGQAAQPSLARTGSATSEPTETLVTRAAFFVMAFARRAV